MDIKQSKSILAKLLATENISVQHKAIPTAYFDVKNRVLALPIWKDMSLDLYDLLTGHEVGHALFTPAQGWHDAVTGDTDSDIDPRTFKGFLNVIEDARIEKLIKRRYPGLAKNMYAGYRDLLERDFFEVTDDEIPDLLFIDRINLHFKLGAFQAVPFTDAEHSIVAEIEHIETWDQVVEMATRLYGLAKEELADKQMKYELTWEYGQGAEEDDSGIGMPLDLTEREADDLREKVMGMTQPESLTDRAFRDKEKELVDEKSQPYEYFSLGAMDSRKFIWDYKKMLNLLQFKDNQEVHRLNLHLEFRNRNIKMINYLVKEFELHRNAAQQARARVSKSGEIDLKKVFGYKYNEDLFLKVTTMPKGKNHGLVMFYDMSGSMSSYFAPTIEQMLVLVEFCRKVNIPFEVYGFTNDLNDTWERGYESRRPVVAENGLSLGDASFRLQQYFTDAMTTNEYKYMLTNMLMVKRCWEQRNMNYNDPKFIREYSYTPPDCEHLHSTPLNQTIVLSRDIFKRFKERTGADVVNMAFLTDGEADGSMQVYKPNNGTGYFNSDYEGLPSTIYTNVFIKDTVTNYEVQVPRKEHRCGYTPAFLELVRHATGANIVGFYLTANVKSVVDTHLHGSKWDHGNRTKDDIAAAERIMTAYRKDRVAVLTQSGFSEYYVVHHASMAIDDDAEIEGENIRDIGKNFRKMHKGRLVNRVLLNRFIRMIA